MANWASVLNLRKFVFSSETKNYRNMLHCIVKAIGQTVSFKLIMGADPETT